jgi:hypothetical protein
VEEESAPSLAVPPRLAFATPDASARQLLTLATVNRPATLDCRALFEAAFQMSKQSRDAFVELPPQLVKLMAAARAAIARRALRIPRGDTPPDRLGRKRSERQRRVTFPHVAQPRAHG